MLKRTLSRLAKSAIASLLLIFVVSPRIAAADDAAPQGVHLQLEVSINGQPAGLISDFIDLGDGRFASTAGELRELRIKTPDGLKDDEVINLDSVPGLSYVYDEQKQSIALETSDENRIVKNYDARGELNQTAVTPSDYGAVLNYTLFGSYGGAVENFSSFRASNFSGVNATLDARLIAPVGVFNQTAIVGMTLAEETETLRLDSSYTFSDEDNMVRWRAGDFISGGTSWSRPIRMGGLQAQRAFSMRPDLVRNPLPIVSGSAAVPSSVDVFVNGIKSYSKDVAAGPYQIDNIPAISGPGVAQVVTRDASGRETVQTLSFYNSPQLLRPGLSDFSVETGFARSHYGIESNDYGDALVGSATFREGIEDWLTFEAHGEAGDSLINAGAGLVARVGDKGVVSGAVSASSSRRGVGTQLYGGFETKVGPVSVNGRFQHALDKYEDLASLTARDNLSATSGAVIGLPGISNGLFTFAPPRAIDSLTVSMPIAADKSTISATYLRYQSDDVGTTELLTANYSRPIFDRASLQATGYVDVNNTSNAGVYVGVSMALDNNISLNTGANYRDGSFGGNVAASKPVTQEPGSWGWRISDTETATPMRAASIGYRASAARFDAGVTQDAAGTRSSVSVDGALAMIGGDVYASNHIDDSFAVVDAHMPGVKVQRENVFVGETNEDGKVLIPNLASYQRNKISIDPMDLPLNAEPATTYDYVRPGFKSGIYVDFDIKKASPSAIVILKNAKGDFLEAGSEGKLEGSSDTFVVGYDGQAYIKELAPVNTAHVVVEGVPCTVQFAYAPTSDVQPVIGPEICQ